MIQLVMRQCFFFSNLLLATQLPQDAPWLAQLLINDRLMPLFFSGLVAGTMIPAAIFIAVYESPDQTRGFKLLRGLLAFLVAVQILLLPINYGVLITDKSLPRVASIGGERVVEGQKAWLVWEGKEGVTFLMHSANGAVCSLLTLPRPEVKKTEITGYDRIATILCTGKGEK